MNLEISRMHFPVTVLGYGTRAGIWVQGCSIGCAGCVSQDTWPRRPEAAMRLDDIESWLRSLPAEPLDGVTISGGEPFDQDQALAGLLTVVAGMNVNRLAVGAAPLDVLCYSGYALEKLQREFPEILTFIDVLVSDPYLERRPASAPLRGSDNQRLTRLTELGRQRYSDEALSEWSSSRFQVTADTDSLWYIGIPRRGDMERLEQLMESRGLLQRSPSWRA